MFANLLGGPGMAPFPNFNMMNGHATNQPPFMPLPGASALPFPMMSPFLLPPPPMPPALDTLTDEELRRLEGTERQHVEERIRVS